MKLSRYNGTDVTMDGDWKEWAAVTYKGLPVDDRLYKVLLCVACILGMEPCEFPVVEIRDCKGDLEVVWSRQPKPLEKRVFGKVWAYFWEVAENVEHFVLPDRGE